MSAPDFPDWATPVGLLDTSVLIGNANWVLHNGQSLTNVDSSRYSSIGIALDLPASVAGQRYLMVINWKESGHVIDSETLAYHSGLSYSNGASVNTLYWHLPVRGSAFDVTIYGSDNSDSFFYLIGSTRDLAGSPPTVGNDWPSRLLLNYGTAIGAASATPTLYVPPTTSKVRIVYSYAITAGNLNVQAVARATGTVNAQRTFIVQATGQALTTVDIAVPATGLEIVLTNNDAAAHTGSIQAWDVS